MFGEKLADKLVGDSVVTVLDEVKSVVDSTNFKAIADKVLNKLEGLFKDDGMADDMVEAITARIRSRLDVEDSDPNN